VRIIRLPPEATRRKDQLALVEVSYLDTTPLAGSA